MSFSIIILKREKACIVSVVGGIPFSVFAE